MTTTKGLRGFAPPPKILNQDPLAYAKTLSDWLNKAYQQMLGGMPPIHGTHHRLDGLDPLDAPETLPQTVSGDSENDQGTDPLFARAGHSHELDTSGTPGAIVGSTGVQGAGPGASLSGHTHPLPTTMSSRAFAFFISRTH